MRRKIIIIGVLAVVALIAGVWVYQNYLAPQPEPEPESQPEEETARVVPATGVVLPCRWATLSFTIGGVVDEVLVQEGDQVQEGQALVTLQEGDLQLAVEQAEAALGTAQAALDQAKAPPLPEELSAAEARLTAAQARLDKLRSGPTQEEITAAKGQLEIAKVALGQAQAAYDEVSWLEEIQELPQALALQQATVEYEIANANYNALIKGPSAQDIAVAQAEVDAARASLAQLRSGARPVDVGVAEARVEEAGVALSQARSALEDAQLSAPFASTVGSLRVRANEMISPGASVVMLGDLGEFKVETTDLNEIEIDLVKVGQRVDLTFDALPGRSIQGTVARIAPMANVEQGGTNFTVTVELEEQDPGLRWGMTAFVDILVEAR
jgi:multidrug efflux pump subunit AcrA (membrane-fusion protein)